MNFVSPDIFEFISEFSDYEDTIQALRKIYEKPKNEIYARHLLATRRQEHTETIDEYYRELCKLGKNCVFRDTTASENTYEYIRDSFITGLKSNAIRRRLLERDSLDVQLP